MSCSKSIIFAADVRATDVRPGQGTGRSEHYGNKIYRHYCSEQKELWLRGEKRQAVNAVIARVENSGGRFLAFLDKKADQTNKKGKKKTRGVQYRYILMDEETLRRKINNRIRLGVPPPRHAGPPAEDNANLADMPQALPIPENPEETVVSVPTHHQRTVPMEPEDDPLRHQGYPDGRAAVDLEDSAAPPAQKRLRAGEAAELLLPPPQHCQPCAPAANQPNQPRVEENEDSPDPENGRGDHVCRVDRCCQTDEKHQRKPLCEELPRAIDYFQQCLQVRPSKMVFASFTFVSSKLKCTFDHWRSEVHYPCPGLPWKRKECGTMVWSWRMVKGVPCLRCMGLKVLEDRYKDDFLRISRKENVTSREVLSLLWRVRDDVENNAEDRLKDVVFSEVISDYARELRTHVLDKAAGDKEDIQELNRNIESDLANYLKDLSRE